MVEILGDDGCGDKFAEGDDLVVVEVIVFVVGLKFVDGQVELVEEVENLVNDILIVWNQRLGDVDVVVFELLS